MTLEDKKVLQEALGRITVWEERLNRYQAMLETAERVADDGDYSVTIRSNRHTNIECELGLEGTRLIEGYLIPYLQDGIAKIRHEIDKLEFPKPVVERDVSEEAAWA